LSAQGEIKPEGFIDPKGKIVKNKSLESRLDRRLFEPDLNESSRNPGDATIEFAGLVGPNVTFSSQSRRLSTERAHSE
jgi:hypothetical protein